MKIVQVSHMFYDGGGREEHIYQISKYLAKKGHLVTIVTSDYTPTGEFTIKKKADLIPGIKIVALKGFLSRVPPGRLQIPDLMDFLIDYKADIIHAHGMGEQPAEDAFYAAKITNTPFVYTLHFAPYTIYKRLNADHVWKVFQEYHTHNLLRGADKIISVTPEEKKDIIQYTNYKGNNFEIVPNGFDQDVEKITPQIILDAYKKYNIPEGRKYVVFVGALTNPRKGAFEAIQAFRSAKNILPNLHLILIGNWDSRLGGNNKGISRVLEKLAKANHVTVTGWINEKDKYALLSGANLFLSPTLYEAFGIAICEALYNKLPVLTTNIGGGKYIVRDNKDGLLVDNPEDIQGFADKIVWMIQHPEESKAMGESGYKRVKELFSWEKTGAKLEAIYKNLLDH